MPRLLLPLILLVAGILVVLAVMLRAFERSMPAERVCSRSDCQSRNPPSAQYCGQCGNRLDEED